MSVGNIRQATCSQPPAKNPNCLYLWIEKFTCGIGCHEIIVSGSLGHSMHSNTSIKLNHINSISFYIYWKMRAAVFNCPRFWNSHGLQLIVCPKQRQSWNPRIRQPTQPSPEAPVLNVEMGFGETWGVHSINVVTDSQLIKGFSPRNGVKDISEPAICISFAQ